MYDVIKAADYWRLVRERKNILEQRNNESEKKRMDQLWPIERQAQEVAVHSGLKSPALAGLALL